MIRKGIQEAHDVFWNHIDSRRPPIFSNTSDRGFVGEALLLALAQLNVIRDQDALEESQVSDSP